MKGLTIAIEASGQPESVVVTADNGRFRGEAQAYVDLDVPYEWSEAIGRGPGPGEEPCTVSLGNVDPAYPDGGCRLRIEAEGGQGHLVCTVTIKDSDDIVTLRFPSEPALLDEFVAGLRSFRGFHVSPGTSATLRMTA